MDMKSGLEELRRRREEALLMGGKANVERQHQRGHLTARERIDKLLDPGTFSEVGILNQSDIPGMEDKTPADGNIVGFGRIDGRTVLVSAADRTVLAGTEGRVGSFIKEHRASATALQYGCPMINLGDGGGARIPDIMGSDGLSSMTFPAEGLRYPRKTPFVGTIMGDCFGGPSWMAAKADFVVMVKGCCMAVSGPRVLEIAMGEKITRRTSGAGSCMPRLPGRWMPLPKMMSIAYGLSGNF